MLTVGVWIALRVWFNYLDHYIERHLDEGTFISLKSRRYIPPSLFLSAQSGRYTYGFD
jgi:hypothetical protein